MKQVSFLDEARLDYSSHTRQYFAGMTGTTTHQGDLQAGFRSVLILKEFLINAIKTRY